MFQYGLFHKEIQSYVLGMGNNGSVSEKVWVHQNLLEHPSWEQGLAVGGRLRAGQEAQTWYESCHWPSDHSLSSQVELDGTCSPQQRLALLMDANGTAVLTTATSTAISCDLANTKAAKAQIILALVPFKNSMTKRLAASS